MCLPSMSPFGLQAVRSLMLSTRQRLQPAAVITARPVYVRITIQTIMARSSLIRTVTTSKPSAMSRSDLVSHFADIAVKLTDRGKQCYVFADAVDFRRLLPETEIS